MCAAVVLTGPITLARAVERALCANLAGLPVAATPAPVLMAVGVSFLVGVFFGFVQRAAPPGPIPSTHCGRNEGKVEPCIQAGLERLES
jgi:hypothetical protein